MKNYIDSQEHWEDSINADYDKKEQMQKEMEKEINKQIEMQIRGQELPIHNVSGLLPSDEIIKETAWNYGEKQIGSPFNKYQADQAFKEGAIWMRDVILGNKR